MGAELMYVGPRHENCTITLPASSAQNQPGYSSRAVPLLKLCVVNIALNVKYFLSALGKAGVETKGNRSDGLCAMKGTAKWLEERKNGGICLIQSEFKE